MKTKLKWFSALGVLSSFVIAVSCNKNNSGSDSSIPPGQSKVSIFMMDGPASYYKVLIDIRQVAVEIDTSTNQSSADNDRQWDDDYCGWGRDSVHKSVIWDTLSINPGVYDLLALRNGVDTLLASGEYP